MTSPLPVTVVRPKSTTREAIVTLVSNLLLLALRGYIVMALAPHVIDWHPSYFASVSACLVFGSLRGQTDAYRFWTKEATR